MAVARASGSVRISAIESRQNGTLQTETVNEISTFAELGLREELLRALEDAGYTQPTPIQARAIPEVLAGRNLVGIAQTGTGKTAAFLLPVLQKLAGGRSRARMPRALILSPTRELATQTARNFELFARHLPLHMVLLIGGVGMGEQEKILERGDVDVVIATPGRLLDWFERGRILLSGVEILVIDEADRMLDMGFMPDVERIIRLLVRRRQTLLFSATMPPEVRRLVETFVQDPVEVAVTPPARKAESVEDVFVPTEAAKKRQTLVRLLRTRGVEKAMIFCNTKREVAALTRHLRNQGFAAEDIHGDLEQSVRQKTLDRFLADEISLLVCTDVAARGLDIPEMPVVINFDVPLSAEDYVHRIGRTGRAGHTGRAFTLITPADAKRVAAIERLTKRKVPRLELEPAEPAPEKAERAPGREEAASASAPAVAEPAAATAARPAGVEGRRRRRRKEPAAGSATAPAEAAGRTPEAAAPSDGVAQPEAASSAARGESTARRRRRDGTGDADTARSAKTTARRDGKAAKDEPAAKREPVVGMGEHVPRFLLKPIPLRGNAREGAERP